MLAVYKSDYYENKQYNSCHDFFKKVGPFIYISNGASTHTPTTIMLIDGQILMRNLTNKYALMTKADKQTMRP
jgi:hypothetical protein